MKNFQGSYNLTHQVTNDLGLAIVQGKYQPDQSFPTEAQLAEKYEISRSVMREAVKMLTAKGLISSRPRQGIRLQPNTQWNMFDSDVLGWTLNSRPSLNLLHEFTQLRFGIEPEAAALAAKCNDNNAMEVIEKALHRMYLAELGQDDTLEADIAFHTSILLASNNRFFIQLRRFIETALRVSITYTNRLAQVKFASYEEHKKVFEPIKAGNADEAVQAMRALLQEALDLIDGALAKNN